MYNNKMKLMKFTHSSDFSSLIFWTEARRRPRDATSQSCLMCNLDVPIWLCCQATAINRSPSHLLTTSFVNLNTQCARREVLRSSPVLLARCLSFVLRTRSGPRLLGVASLQKHACWERFDGVQPLQTSRHAAGRAD